MRRAPPRSSAPWRVIALAVIAVGVGAGMFAARASRAIDASWASVTVDVPELDCTFWCSVRLSNILDAMPGVRAESFEPRTRQVRVRYDAALRAEADILHALIGHGIRAQTSPANPR